MIMIYQDVCNSVLIFQYLYESVHSLFMCAQNVVLIFAHFYFIFLHTLFMCACTLLPIRKSHISASILKDIFEVQIICSVVLYLYLEQKKFFTFLHRCISLGVIYILRHLHKGVGVRKMMTLLNKMLKLYSIKLMTKGDQKLPKWS